jgi:hypothetical protein
MSPAERTPALVNVPELSMSMTASLVTRTVGSGVEGIAMAVLL